VVRNKRPLLWLLPLGLALGHFLGTCFGDHAGAPALEAGRSLFGVLGLVGAPLALWAMLRLFKAGQDRNPVQLSCTAVIVTQVGAFLAIETVEHLVTGVPLGKLLGHPGLWWALAGQVVIAYLVATAARLAVAAGQACGERTKVEWPPSAAPARPGLRSDVVEQWLAGGSVQRRGPPAISAR
jgi:hypothetical protein